MPPRSSAALTEAPQEFPFSETEFRFLADLLRTRTGIVLNSSKMNMVYTRLARRLRELALDSFADYCAIIKGSAGADEMGYLINALTTNLTRFFREPHHFDHLGTAVLPALAAHPSPQPRRLRIWSAGCSSGEEPYSIAMTLAEELDLASRWDARILATDLDTNMVETGRKGLYSAAALADLPPGKRDEHFEPLDAARWSAKNYLRQLITFKQLNLMEAWPVKGPFDVIFCRNVMIYFDNPTKSQLIGRFHDLLKPGGFLYVGHSETLLDNRTSLKLAGRTIYRKGNR